MALRGALIGLGDVAVHGHLPGWLERRDVEIVAATDTRPARETELRCRLPQARWYPSADALWAGEPLDFVDICTPPETHAGLIEAALRHGLHVLCEKPLVCRPEDLAPLADLARARNRILHTVHNWHQAPVIRKVRGLLHRGAIGDVHRCLWQTLRTKPAGADETGTGNWRVDPAVAGGGVLMDHGWHALYVVQGWLGRAPTRIGARLETRRHTQWSIEDTATVRLEWPGATGEILVTWAADVRRNWVRLDGAGGSLRIEDDTVVASEAAAAGRERRWVCPPALSNGSYHPDWFGAVASEFVAEVSGTSPTPGASLAEAALCATLVALAQESSRRGGASLPVPELFPMAAGPSREEGIAGADFHGKERWA